MKEYTCSYQVADTDTACAMGSGNLPVLATPALVAYIENACCACLAEELSLDQTSVGTAISLQHVAPSKPAATIRVEIHMQPVDGRQATFDVAAFDGNVLVGKGTHQRVIIDPERFLNRL